MRRKIKEKYRPWKNMVNEFYLFKEDLKTEGIPKNTRALTGKIIERTEKFFLLEGGVKLMRTDVLLNRKTDKDYFKGKLPQAWDWDCNKNKWKLLEWIKN